MKGVILAGGFGTRLYPLARVINKHLFPVYNKLMIYYPIETLLKMNILDIMIVTSIEAVRDFSRLLGDGDEFVAELNRINKTTYSAPRFHYAVQKGAGGIADALRLAEIFAGKENITVILGDNIFEDDFTETAQSFSSGSLVFLKEVKSNSAFGVPAFDTNKKLISIEEKPQEPKSPYAVTGLYIYDARIFDIIQTLKPSARGELEITDVNNWYIAHHAMAYRIVNGFWSDAGTVETLHNISMYMASKDKKR